MEQITNKIIIEFGKTIEMFGLTPLEAHLFALLYLADKPMTLDDMANALGKSKTSMSTSVRGLSELNLVTRVWKKGVRKDLYKANSQLFKIFMTSYMNKWIDAIQHQIDELEEIKSYIEQQKTKPNPEWNKLTMDLQNIIEFHRQMESFYKGIK